MFSGIFHSFRWQSCDTTQSIRNSFDISPEASKSSLLGWNSKSVILLLWATWIIWLVGSSRTLPRFLRGCINKLATDCCAVWVCDGHRFWSIRNNFIFNHKIAQMNLFSYILQDQLIPLSQGTAKYFRLHFRWFVSVPILAWIIVKSYDYLSAYFNICVTIFWALLRSVSCIVKNTWSPSTLPFRKLDVCTFKFILKIV